MPHSCEDEHLLDIMMISISGQELNDTEQIKKLLRNCENETYPSPIPNQDWPFSSSAVFYSFVTPFILLVGLFGNIVSLKIFLTTRLNKLSASSYLIAISVSDSLVLLSYVLLEWLNKGLPAWPGHHRIAVVNVSGVCQTFLFISYVSRFISIWLIVVFTVERYFAVCRPLQQRQICTRRFARRAIMCVVGLAILVSAYKPILSGVYRLSSNTDVLFPNEDDVIEYKDDQQQITTPLLNLFKTELSNPHICMRNPKYQGLHFVMDIIYGLFITAIPFIPIILINGCILRSLVRRASSLRKVRKNGTEKRFRTELTIILLVISASLICLNLPYFVVWCMQLVQSRNARDPSEAHLLRNYLFVTRTIFSVNYAVNFFLYCLAGAYYRKALVLMLRCNYSAETIVSVVQPVCGKTSVVNIPLASRCNICSSNSF